MKYCLTLLFIFLLASACQEQKLGVVLPFEGSKFVLYSELSPNKVVDVVVERTYPPTGSFDFDSEFLDITRVDLYENNVFVDSLSRVGNTNSFKSNTGFKPSVGKGYYFVVSGEGFEDAQSETQSIPDPVRINSIVFSNENVVSPLNPSIPSRLLEIELDGNSLKEGYLIAEIRGMYKGHETSSNVIDVRDAGELTNPCMYNLASYLKFYDVKCLNKGVNKLSYIVEMNGSVQVSGFGNQNVDSFRIKLSTVSTFYYDFYKKNIQPDGIFKAFEPTQKTLTNVKNGYGAVLGKNEQVQFIRVQ
ncbi:protein of unknown function [Spirosomataceae bacterium TFI 002]|nr:protein of unknown function [Spirosomataceae bacterium TFI 002]